ncbi:ABC transporter ATP-binding protein [Corynebacterium glucuronolyticum]|uniref:ABC transporter ATP-binding protein n=1 Tax=Corynebacterium glucuronolyticum TaxID=39791 RepID=UPI00223B1D9D|nr:ABC transporter ATP-binding protein [Corynebacterium glucuronolyticum]MCT1443374.1 ABC transporter ATP-binding protein [Corynebacterium glucuronolyticum]
MSTSNRLVIDSSEVAILCNQVSKSYRIVDQKSADSNHGNIGHGGKIVEAVKNISLLVERGQSVGLIGRNGSGKSTLMRMIAGSESASSGQVLVSHRPTLMGIAPALHPWLTGRQNILLGCLAIGMDYEAAKEEVEPIAEWTSIGDAIDRPMSTYSSGMAARVSFAISTAVQPDILLIDEALSTGDAAFQRKAAQRTQQLLDRAGTMVLVSHYPNQIREMCEIAVWMDSGRIVSQGASNIVSKQYAEWTSMLDNSKILEAEKFLKECMHNSPKVSFSSSMG